MPSDRLRELFRSGVRLWKGTTDDERLVSWRAAASYVVLACLTTWPLVRQLGSALPGWGRRFGAGRVDAGYVLDDDLCGREPTGHHAADSLPARDCNEPRAELALGSGPGRTVLACRCPRPRSLLRAASPARPRRGRPRHPCRCPASHGQRSCRFWGAGLLFGVAPAVATSLANPFYMRTWGFVALLPWALASLLTFLDRPDARAGVAVTVCTWALAFTDFYAIAMWIVLGTVIGLMRWRWALWRPVLAIALANLGLAVVVLRWVLSPVKRSGPLNRLLALGSREHRPQEAARPTGRHAAPMGRAAVAWGAR